MTKIIKIFYIESKCKGFENSHSNFCYQEAENAKQALLDFCKKYPFDPSFLSCARVFESKEAMEAGAFPLGIMHS